MIKRPLTLTKEKIIEFKKALASVESFSNISFRKNYGRKKKNPEVFIKRTRRFLNLIGSPDKNFKFVHVTGTAGKGTVSTMIHNTLVSEGKKVGLFTSPYTTTAIEKIKVNDLYISPQKFTQILNYLKPFIVKARRSSVGGPSSFELFLAIALLYFKQMKCEWVVLEAGLGGRYDATNVIKSPRVTAITNVDFDHTEILGKTLKEIARDKGGIIKKGSSFLTTETRPALLAIFKSFCRSKGARFLEVNERGDYHDKNLALARKIAQIIEVSEKNIKQGLEQTALPCRFERVSKSPIVILDGAHNRAKMRSTVTNLIKLKYKKLFVILAVANTNKDSRAAIEPIVPLANEIVLTSFSRGDQHSIHPKVILSEVNRFKRKGVKVNVIEDLDKALDYFLAKSDRADCILVTGSFFLAGQMRKRWYPENLVLKQRKSF
ncbi:MAG: Mur ligase family protein [bacterium]|nr:Mur ligase family protein [bacterium]MDZ4205826.1 Mur ligase family protein [Patescibacteria group bacterium]